MYRFIFSLMLMVLLTTSSGCQQQASAPAVDMTRLQNAIQKKTEDLLRVHLKLDTAATEMEKAEDALRNGNSSAAEFHTSEAHRNVLSADEIVLDLGQELQEMVNLDVGRSSRN